MVLSDGTIRAEIAAGRLAFDPFDPSLVQPSSVDVRVDRRFRVFRNTRYPYIDVRQPMEDLTELLTVEGDEPFILHPGEFVLGQTLERVTLPDDLVARLEGKALALDTPVPTPEGWTTIGELQPGDRVFDPDGRPIPVVAATGVMHGRPCREIEFSDGMKVVCDRAHHWEVQTKYDRKLGRSRVLTTEQIGRSLVIKAKKPEFAYHVPLAKAVQFADRDLPIDPYVLGAWIGDGTSAAAVITCADEPILQEFALAGYSVSEVSGPIAYRVGGAGTTRDPGTGRYTRNSSLSSRLRDLGLLGNKHIPAEYLNAGIAARMALLEGLMDTDGYVDAWGRCELTTVRESLAHQYRELVASLGYRPVIAVKTATISGRACGLKYDVTFTPHKPVFRLPRKAYRQTLTRQAHLSRAIVDVRPVDSVPVRCIEVGTRRGAFLITRSFITTHNSSLGRMGLLIHSTAGFVDAGFEGNLTLELSNVANLPITIYHGMPIGQISFMRMDSPVERPYGSDDTGSKYQGQAEPTPSRFYLNFERSKD